MKKLILYLVLSLLLPAGAANAKPTTPRDARLAVTGWLAMDPRPLGAALGKQVRKVRTFRDDFGDPLYHIVYLVPRGFVIVAGDDLVEPVIGFLPNGRFDPSLQNPLGALVSRDVPGRVRETRMLFSRSTVPGLGHEPSSPEGRAEAARQRWETLRGLSASTSESKLTGLRKVSDVRVSPMVASKWNQAGADGSLPPTKYACYNYFTPAGAPGDSNNMVAGCVATTMAQLFRYWRHPGARVGTKAFPIKVNGTSQQRRLRGGDGAGGPYDWARMPLTTSAATPLAQRKAIGALTHDAGVAIRTQYNTMANGGSGAYIDNIAGAVKNVFQYANVISSHSPALYPDVPQGKLKYMINPNLDAGYPVLLSIYGIRTGGHVAVCDGYGFHDAVVYHHLNMGWSGYYDAWYNLPDVFTTYYDFDAIYSCIYNIYPTGNGEIVSGRVLDASGVPISGAAVTAEWAGGGKHNATSDSNGVYAIRNVPSGTSLVLKASAVSCDFAGKTVATGESVHMSMDVGNVWGADFDAGQLPRVISPSLSSVTGTTARLSALIATGGPPAMDAGFVYGLEPNPTLEGSKVSSPDTTGPYGVDITGLSPNTVYHFRGYAINAAGIAYTKDATLTTLPVPIATAATEVGITEFTANWTTPGTGTISAYELTWSLYPDCVPGSTKTLTGTSYKVTNCQGGTTYYYRVRARKNADWGTSSNIISVTTLPPNLPTIKNPRVLGFLSTSEARLGSTIVSSGDGQITERGIVYGSMPNPETTGEHVKSAGDSFDFSVDIAGLAQNTIYYFRGYVINLAGTSYTEEATFTMPTPETVTVPALREPSAGGIGKDRATLGVAIVSDGGLWITSSGVVVSTEADPVAGGPGQWSTNPTVRVGSFGLTVTGLSPNTLYHYRGYATNSEGTGYTEDKTFTTLSAPPTLGTAVASAISETGATLGATIQSDGGLEITASGIAYGTSANPSILDGSYLITNPLVGSGPYSLRVEGLKPYTYYYYRGFATNSQGTGYSRSDKFRTLAGVPALQAQIASEITPTGATLGASLVSDGGFPIIASGIVYGSGPNPDLSGSKVNTKSPVSSGDFTVLVDGLTPNTLYHYRGYATNSKGTGYSESRTFTTPATVPSLGMPTQSSVTAKGVSLAVTILSNGGLPVSGSGVVLGTVPNPDLTNATMVLNTDPVVTSGPFTLNAAGLEPKTAYYCRGFATNPEGTGYSADVRFTTYGEEVNPGIYLLLQDPQ